VTDIGTYEVVVTSQLDNLELFNRLYGYPATTIDPAIKFEITKPPFDFKYKTSFGITVNVVSPTSVFIPPPVNPPFLVPTPTDIWFFATD
jgi:hypothetical protein